MGTLLKKLRKHWIVIWLVAATVSFTVIMSYAIYTRITIAKRVVSTEAASGSLFSSDYMISGGMMTTQPFTDDSVDPPVLVHVYNYVYPKEAVYRSEETIYDLKATIGKLDEYNDFTELSGSDKSGLGSYTYSIKYEKDASTFSFGPQATSHTFSDCTIEGDKANEDLFTVVFDKNELGDAPNGYCIKIEAVPYDNELPTLTGYLTVRFSRQASSGWQGKLEALEASKEDDYDGYNYYLEGNGKGKLTFRWNSEYVRINKDFIENSDNQFDGGVTDEGSGIKSVTIIVDSIKKNRYEVQFFKVDPSEDVYSIAEVKGYLPDTQPGDWVPSSE